MDPAARPGRGAWSGRPSSATTPGTAGDTTPAGVAVDRAIERARTRGSALVVLRNSNHYGIAGWYALRAAEAGLIGDQPHQHLAAGGADPGPGPHARDEPDRRRGAGGAVRGAVPGHGHVHGPARPDRGRRPARRARCCRAGRSMPDGAGRDPRGGARGRPPCRSAAARPRQATRATASRSSWTCSPASWRARTSGPSWWASSRTRGAVRPGAGVLGHRPRGPGRAGGAVREAPGGTLAAAGRGADCIPMRPGRVLIPGEPEAAAERLAERRGVVIDGAPRERWSRSATGSACRCPRPIPGPSARRAREPHARPARRVGPQR